MNRSSSTGRTHTSTRYPTSSPLASGDLTTRPSGNTPASGTTTVRIRSTRHRAGTLLLDMPIGARLTLSFIIAAFIAASVAGTLGLLRAQSLSQQSIFYQNLLHTNTRLTTGAQFLQVMNSEVHTIIAQSQATQSSTETITKEISATRNLANGYNKIITDFINNDLLTKNTDQRSLLQQSDNHNLTTQQETLAASALRTWNLYKTAQTQILQDITDGKLADAQQFLQIHVESANADALSGIRSLSLFNNRLAETVQNTAALEEQQQLIITIISSIITFLAILLIGWLISGTLVRRLRQLRQMTQAVEHGELTSRINVVGRDEIADVSASVNAMLDVIVNLLNETRSQRDALSNAADHLFSDMRVVSAGDLRINAPVSNDPIGMLANAFNFTVGRFRRFVLRTKATAEQLDVIARQQLERAETFTQNLQSQSPQQPVPIHPTSPSSSSSSHSDTIAQLRRVREELHQFTNEGILRQTRTLAVTADQIMGSLDRLNKLPASNSLTLQANAMTTFAQELRTLDPLLKRMLTELQNVHKLTLKGSHELDKDLEQLGALLRVEKSRGTRTNTEGQHSSPDAQVKQELARLSHAFSNDINAMARQLTILAQEMRNGVVAFQFEGTEAGPQSLDSVAFPTHTSTSYNLSLDMQSQQPATPALPPHRR